MSKKLKVEGLENVLSQHKLRNFWGTYPGCLIIYFRKKRNNVLQMIFFKSI